MIKWAILFKYRVRPALIVLDIGSSFTKFWGYCLLIVLITLCVGMILFEVYVSLEVTHVALIFLYLTKSFFLISFIPMFYIFTWKYDFLESIFLLFNLLRDSLLLFIILFLVLLLWRDTCGSTISKVFLLWTIWKLKFLRWVTIIWLVLHV
jgi:hypothetical protein